MPHLVPLKVESRALPAIVVAADNDARERFLEFFASNIRNQHTRRAYLTAVEDFLDWCEQAGVGSFRQVRPLHVAAWVEQQTQTHKAPTAKLRLAAIRHLFDWLVNGQVVPLNPAASVRGSTHVVRKGQTPLLKPKEARKLLDSIDKNKIPPGPLPRSEANTESWCVPPLPEVLKLPGIEISGPASISSRMVQALNPGPEGERAGGYLDDDEDSGGHSLADM